MLISVIIPTYNRKRVLGDCLRALLRQTLPLDRFEVIVVDDGSRDETKSVVSSFMKNDFNLKYVRQENQGQGVARNTGVAMACGKIIVLNQDDIIVRKDFLEEHLRMHLRHAGENEAVLGFTTWHPKLTLTNYMQWLTNGSSIMGKFGGHQFAYEKLKGKSEADYNFFYTSNLSLKKSLLEKYPFDPSFSGYGWEDIELGYRLFKRVGLKIYYNPKAIGYHDHVMTEEGMASRMRSIGAAAHIIHKKYPELNKVPPVWKKLIFQLLSSGIFIFLFKCLRNLTQGKCSSMYYYALSKKYFLEGLKESPSLSYN